MENMHCYICSDISSFNLKVSSTKRILLNIKNILRKYGSYHELKKYEGNDVNFSFDRQHQHFMCGYCYKVNENELRNVENEIDSCLLKFCELISENKSIINISDYNLILRNLSGYYPGKYNVLKKFWYTK